MGIATITVSVMNRISNTAQMYYLILMLDTDKLLLFFNDIMEVLQLMVGCLFLQLFELGPDGGDHETDGDLLAETDVLAYDCAARYS